MTSNKLSQRRSLLKRPIVCRKPPPVPLPPPPPPPPPPPWPPDTFDLRWIASWVGWDGPHSFDVDIELIRTPDTWTWIGVLQPEMERWDANWQPDQTSETARLELFSDYAMEFVVSSKDPVIVTWDTSTPYDITDWDSVYPPDLVSQALFVF